MMEAPLEAKFEFQDEECNFQDVPDLVSNIKQEIQVEESTNIINFEEEPAQKLEDQSMTSEYVPILDNVKIESIKEENTYKWDINEVEHDMTTNNEDFCSSNDICEESKDESSRHSPTQNAYYSETYKSLMYKCLECNYRSVRKDFLNRHAVRHKKTEQIYKCLECEYIAFDVGSIRRHAHRHTKHKDVKMHKCSHCDYQSPHKKLTDLHMLQHKSSEEIEKYSYKCFHCKYQTFRKDSLVTHMICHRNMKSYEMFKCSECQYETKRKGDFRRHVLRHQAEPRNFVSCPICIYKTIHPSALKRHIMRHKKAKETHKCSKCDYQTIYKTRFGRHICDYKSDEKAKAF